jgi:hypothetical protein
MENKMTDMVYGIRHTARITALHKLYIELAGKGHEVRFLNERYLEVDGCSYMLKKKGDGLVVRMF